MAANSDIECDLEAINQLVDNGNAMEDVMRPSSINGGEKMHSNHTSTHYGGNTIMQSKSWLDQMGNNHENEEHIT